MALQIESTPADRAIEYAANLGTEHGTNAAEWYAQDTFGGRVWSKRGSHAAAIAVLRGIRDGDPDVLDCFPRADLSGEWADTLTGPQLVEQAIVHADDWSMTRPAWIAYWEANDVFTDVCDAYEQAFSDAVQSEIERTARLALE